MGSRKASIALSEIYKRVPPNQLKQFEEFSKKYTNYSRLMSKYPENLPTINWEEYKSNVRNESLTLLEEFQKKYAELNTLFNNRHSRDDSKYYMLLDAEKEEVEKNIEKYKADSETRIKKLEEEIERLKKLKPYKHMTMEEFCILQPEKAKYVPYYGNNNLFWPFDPNEQIPEKSAENMIEQNSEISGKH